MAKEKQHEIYYKDPISSVRSFMIETIGSNKIAHSPRPIYYPHKWKLLKFLGFSPCNKDVKKATEQYNEVPDQIVILAFYIHALKIINSTGNHITIPQMLDNLLYYSQENPGYLNLEDPEIQKIIMEGVYE